MILIKVKRPGGPFTFEVEETASDEHGTWLWMPGGARRTHPTDFGIMPFDIVVLLAEGRPWVAWWCDDPAGRRIEVDTCRPAERTDDGWVFVDLELDVMRYADGQVGVEDRDELEEAYADGHLNDADRALPEATTDLLVGLVERREPPFGDESWERLATLRAR